MDTVLLLNIVEPHYLTLGKWKMAHSIASAHRYLELYRLDHNQNQSFDPAQSLLISNQADMTKGLVMYKVDPKKAKVLLLEAVKTSRGGGRLADFFFPSLEKIGAKDTHKKAFGIVKKQLAEILKVYPKGGNTLNVYAWTAAKARYDLDKAEEYSLRSLESIPRSPAYTDTLAEINFAKGNRKKAIEVSTEAVTEALSYSRSDISSSLRMYKSLDIQLKHFENDPLPRKR